VGVPAHRVETVGGHSPPARYERAMYGTSIAGRRIAGAVGTGVLFALAVPDVGAWPLAFVAWVPLLLAIEGASVRHALALGWIAGCVMIFPTFVWLTEVLGRFAGLPPVAAYGVHLLFTVANGLQWGLFAAGVAGLRGRASPLVVAPLVWAATEALFPQLFPWYAALAVSSRPELLQLAELGGVTLVAAPILAFNAACAEVVSITRLRGALRGGGAPLPQALAVLLLVGVGLPTYGVWRMAAADALATAAPTARIGVVQGNHGIREWSSRETRGGVLARIQAESAIVDAQGVDFLLWGENVYPYRKALAHTGGRDAALWEPQRIRVGFDAPLVFGVVTAEPATDGPLPSMNPYGWNSAVVLAPDGVVGDVYDKNHPLPFGEYAPLVDPAWYLANVKGASHVNPGTAVTVLRVGEWRLGPLICYEDILPRFARTVANQGVHAFVNLTSDTWFGRSAEPAEHLGLAVLRAVEHRRALVRSVNTGPSVYVDPAGRIVQRTELTDPDAEGPAAPVSFVATVPMIDPAYRTPYARFGEWFPTLVVCGVVGLALLRRRPRTA
jgi:apolipoprotein N-acyltransferase